MSHSVTIQTRTVTSGSPSSINTGFCRTWPGLLKLTQVILGIVSLIFLWMHVRDYGYQDHRSVFLLAMISAFFITTLLLVLSYTCSFTTETIISKTTFEVLYHGVGFALLLVSAVLVLTRGYNRYHDSNEKTASIVALVNSILYLLSFIFALRFTRTL